jgi:phage shock protein PspC (stress-responsive transcriptional regulator)
MDTPATYIQLAFIVISVPNLLVIVGMIVLFIVALIAPFPGHHAIESDDDDGAR